MPPKAIYHPVLPKKINGKLMFPLCYTCAKNSVSDCTHNTEDRALIGAWTTPELREAVNQGYRITSIHEVRYWEETTNALFKEYVSFFMKLKQENSSLAKWVKKRMTTSRPTSMNISINKEWNLILTSATARTQE